MTTGTNSFFWRMAKTLPALLMSLAALAWQSAHADVNNYQGTRHQINACVLVSSASSVFGHGPVNPAPYVFYALDRRTDLKPAGYSFVNPLAPSTITNDIYKRWQIRQGGSGDPAFNPGSTQYQSFQVGAPLTRNIGAYWEVNLDNVTAEQLKAFDIVYMPLSWGRELSNAGSATNVFFTPDEREKLRQYADSGGTLWLENDGVSTGGTINFVLNMKAAAGSAPAGLYNTLHPLVSSPYTITPGEVPFIGRGGAYSTLLDPSGSVVAPAVVTPILGSQNGINSPSLYAGDFGGGHLILSGLAVGASINRALGGFNTSGTGYAYYNDGAISGDNTSQAPRLELELFYNAVAWASAAPTAGANNRRVASTQENIGNRLGVKFNVFNGNFGTTGGNLSPTNPNFSGSYFTTGAGAVLSKGVIYSVDGKNILHAFDATPQANVYGNRNPDDGIPDFAFGTAFDEIWNGVVGSGLSAGDSLIASTPTVVSVYDPAAKAIRDMVFVSRSNGTTVAFSALPSNPASTMTSLFTLKDQIAPEGRFAVPGYYNNTNGGTPLVPGSKSIAQLAPTPAFSEGILFALEFNVASVTGADQSQGWRVVPVDVLSSVQGGGFVNVFGNLAAVAPTILSSNGSALLGMSKPAGPLTVGYVTDPLTGAVDRVVYVPQRSVDVSAGQSDPDTVRGFWFSAKGEALVAADNTYKTFRPHGDRARAPWWVPQNNSPARSVNLAPVIHAVQRDTSNNVIAYRDYAYSIAGGANTFDVQYEVENNGSTTRVMTITLSDNLDSSWTVSADYTLDWSAENIHSSNGPTSDELDFALLKHRYFQLYKPSSTGVVATPGPVHSLTGGIALSNQDTQIFNTTGLKDGVNAGNELPDRIYSVHDNFTASDTLTPNTGGTALPNAAVSDVKWMFSPYAGGSFVLNNNTSVTLNPRLVNKDAANGVGAGQVLYNFKAVGAPAILNNTVYVVGTAYQSANSLSTTAPNYTVVMALKANVDATFALGQPIPEPMAGQGLGVIRIVQPNLTKAGNQSGNDMITLNYNSTKPDSENDFTVEPDSGVIHIRNFRANNDSDSLNLALPFYVYLTNNANDAPIEVKNKQTGFGILDNLLWYIVIPNARMSNLAAGFDKAMDFIVPTSGPAVFGNTLTFAAHSIYQAGDVDFPSGGHLNRIISVDIAGCAASQSLVSSSGDRNVFGSELLIDPSTGKPYTNAYPIVSPPLAATNTLAVSSPVGLTALDNQLALIADNHRLLEVDFAGNPVWSLTATRALTVAGGTLADTGSQAATTVSLSHPAVASRFSLNEFLIADTGNNRIVDVDRGGLVHNEIGRVNNDLGFLTPGDPLTLSRPSDVQVYTEQYDSNGTIAITNRDTNVSYTYSGAYYAIHYLIADTGNRRVLEVMDVFDANSNRVQLTPSNGSAPVTMYHQVIFTTRSLKEQNAQYNYRTVYQYRDVDANNNPIFYLVSAVDNSTQTSLESNSANAGLGASSLPGPGGSIVKIRRYNYGNGNSQPTDGDIAIVYNSIAILDKNGNFVRRQPISGPTWCRPFTLASPSNPTKGLTRYLFADANGCYVLREQALTLNGNTTVELVPDWMLSKDDYFLMTGRTLRAGSIQRLPQSDPYTDANGAVQLAPHYLIANSYTGHDASGITEAIRREYNISNFPVVTDGVHGEVFEVRGVDYYASAGTDGVYNGYQTFNNIRNPFLYYFDKTGAFAKNPGSAIVRLIPNEMATGTNTSGTIKRKIGKMGLSTGNLEQPSFAAGPF